MTMRSPADITETMNKIRSLYIRTERDNNFGDHLDRLLSRDAEGNLLPVAQRFTTTRETRGVMVIDEPGGGKSTLIDHALRRHPALNAGPDGQQAWLAGSVPSPATFKSMIGHLLEQSGYPPIEGRREAWSLVQLLRARFTVRGIAVLLIDEAHDLFCADRGLILRAIKSLMQGDEAVAIILSGTGKLRDILRSDPQVQRRFTTLLLPPVDAVADRAHITDMIAAYCKRANLEPPAEADLVDRLVHASRHRFGRCIEAVIGAIERALICGHESLDMGHFAEDWTLKEGSEPHRNIFLAEEWWLIDPDREPEEDMPVVVPRRKRSK
ncbi:TniB family NTP-binding protein [Paracoccus binzhouensis]|uniref:TniB family NTP-binding protein n=1 Tax=Paracoccus binzhouensis TaxID=2796149 RepID=UPI001E559D48|nr:TniB family NTP-binding protein [Paracoccus binzhouensis]